MSVGCRREVRIRIGEVKIQEAFVDHEYGHGEDKENQSNCEADNPPAVTVSEDVGEDVGEDVSGEWEE